MVDSQTIRPDITHAESVRRALAASLFVGGTILVCLLVVAAVLIRLGV
jgi:hypothetical protein